MPIVIPPAGLHPLGLFIESPGPNAPASPILADNIDTTTGEYLDLFVGDDIVDAQVKIALKVVRRSGPAVIEDGQRFQDIRKLGNTATKQIEAEARTALARLVRQGDITIASFEVEVNEGSQDANTVLRYVNMRSTDRRTRSLQLTSGGEVIN